MSLIDYDEHYQIDQSAYELYLNKATAALDFVKRRKNRQEDELLIFKPGADCGVAT